jgi:DNA-binding NarL/FixJ family response regulator
MNNSINVLIIEDEPLIVSALKTTLKHISESKGVFSFDIKTTNNCDSANLEIQKELRTKPLDLVLLDISLLASRDKKLLSGEDLLKEIKHFFYKLRL